MTSGRTIAAVLSSAFACALVASCQGHEPAPASEPPREAAAASVSWEHMNKEERAAYMKSTVLPTMKAHFLKWEADEFGKMNCATCHGDGAKDKSFKMPNPKLPKLPSDPEGFAKLAADEPEAVEFMKGTVVPEMARMLGEKPFDPATHEGFGCFECHTKK